MSFTNPKYYKQTYSLFLLAFILSLLNLSYASSIARQRSKQRLEKLRSRKSLFINGNENFFKNYVLTGQRPYDLILIFITDKSDSSCKGCQLLLKSVKPVAERYKKTREAGKGDVFFILFPYNSQNMNLFQQLNIQTIPKMIYVSYSRSSRLVISKTIDANQLNIVPKHHHFPMFSFEHKAIVDWISRVSNIAPIKIDSPKFSRKMVQIALAIIFALFGLYLIAGDWIQANRRLFKSPCAVFVLIFFIYNISGGQFIRIHGVPQSGSGRDWIYHEARMQYELEGIIVGFLLLIGGFLIQLLIMTQSLPRGKSSTRAIEKDGREHIASGILSENFFTSKSVLSQLPSSFALICSIIAIFWFVFDVFSSKQWGYNHGFVGFFG